MIGRVINQRYEVVERVGESSLFSVFKARDRVMNRMVVVKVLQTPFTADVEFGRALKHSMTYAVDLTHPHVCRVYEVGEDEGLPYFVSEYVRGINLKDRIRRIAPFTLAVAVDFGVAVGEALLHAHVAGLAHGDLRPHNVIVSPEGAVKVTDFGVAAALCSSPDAAASNLARAVHYQAPEVAAGAPANPSSDIYSLGVMLFEMLTGGLPYAGDNPIAVAMKQQNEPTPSPRALNPGVPISLEGITMKAMAKTAEQRYRTVGDLLSDLKSVRDALRFGKPLSWSPLETQRQQATVAVQAAPVPVAAEPPKPAPGAHRMAASRAADDRISPYLKVALATVVVILIIVGIAGTAIWMATFTKPPEQRLADLVGMKLDVAREAADKVNVRLLAHEEFSDKMEAGVIYRSDYDPGRPIRPGRSVNVWVSRGSKMVWVPAITKLPAEQAEAKLKAAGLTLGNASRQLDDKVAFNAVISQNPRSGKRVMRDSAVSVVVSDGPKDVPTPEMDPPSGNEGDPTSGTDDTEAYSTPKNFNLRIKIKEDGRGERRVRVEFDDTRGTHTPIDEMHGVGDLISERVEVYGKEITVRVYYGDDPLPVSEQTVPLDRSGR